MLADKRAKGAYLKGIAADLGVHPHTVRRALARAGAPSRRRRGRVSKLEGYKPLIHKQLADEVWDAVVIFRELQAADYEGQLTLVRAVKYLRGLSTALLVNRQRTDLSFSLFLPPPKRNQGGELGINDTSGDNCGGTCSPRWRRVTLRQL